tara:strand:+ start:352 stop:1083 length:732 start_codon:yes stop_codon:yes gene_type:complete
MNKIFLFFLLIIFTKNLHSIEVQIIDETIGTGLEVTNHSKVSVHYIGRLENNIEFDNSYKRNQTFQFQIGIRQVILGWETGLLGMKEGGKRKIFIPYQLAYGESGAGDLIPAKSNLIFDIEIVKVIPPQYTQLDSYQLKLAMSDDNFTIIDIRNSEQINKTGKIPGSVLLEAFDKKGNFLTDFLSKYQEIIKPGEKVIFVSEKGEISSILANGFVEQLKQKNIYNLKKGIKGLNKINFKFEKN